MLALLLTFRLAATTVTLNSTDFQPLLTALNETTTNSTLTVIFAFNGTMTANEPLFVDGNVLLEAPTNFAVTFTPSPNIRLFQVDPNSTLTLSNFTISGANVTGQIGIAGTLGANGTPQAGNGGNGSVGSNVFGGTILNEGTNIVMNCLFLTNTATGGAGGIGGGGGNSSAPGNTEGGGSGGNGGNGGAVLGGAIYNQGTLVLSNCTLAGNIATGGNGGVGGTNGAGILAFPGAGGTGAPGEGAALYNVGNAMIQACTFQDNLCQGGNSQTAGGKPGGNGNGPNGANGGAGEGGGIFNLGTNTVINCTFAQNFAAGGAGANGGLPFQSSDRAGSGGNGGNGGGAGIFNGTGGLMMVTNCTFANGTVIAGTNGLVNTIGYTNGTDIGEPGVLEGACIANLGGTFLLKNSILAYPTNGSNAFGTITDKGFNISSDTTPSFTAGTSRKNLDPLLETLSTNGGFTLTMALEKPSPAVNAITDGSAPELDERGFLRPAPPAAASIGAYEFNAQGFSLSGNILPEGDEYTNVVILITGSTSSQSVSPDDTGAYSLTGLAADTYTIVPQATNGFNFNPINLQVILSTAQANVSNLDFASSPVFNLGGIVSNLTSGTATLFVFTNAGANNTFVSQTVTGSSNLYTFTNLPAGTYIIIPQPTTTIAFSPASQQATLTTTNNTNINFVVVPPTFTVSGVVSNLSGTVLSVSADLGSSSVQFASTLTDDSGNYAFTNLTAGSYTIVPQTSTGFSFSPPSILVTVPPSTNNQSFFATPPATFSISGRISNFHASATVKAVSSTTTTSATTDANGNFIISNLIPGSYTVTPSPISGLSFSPGSLLVPSLPPSQSNQLFFVIPATQPTNTGIRIANQNVDLAITGFPDVTYRIQASTNLQTWQDISTNTAAANGSISVTNSTAGFTNRFFRAVTP